MMNVLNGGAHADNDVDFQEFMIVPVGARTFSEALRIGAEVFHALKTTLHERGLSTAVGDEGGFAPDLALERGGARDAGRRDPRRRLRPGRPGRDRARPGDVASSTATGLRARARGPHADGRRAGRLLGRAGRPLPDRLDRGRDGRGGLGRLDDARPTGSATGSSSSATTCSSPTPQRLKRGIDAGVANSILIKVNQIGTLTETLAAIRMAREAGYTAVMSHRSGETEDVTIADLAVATGCGQIKTGAPSRSDRVAKYNQLLRIEEALGPEAVYPGRSAFRS